MGLLYKSEIPDSTAWVGQNAQDILDSVKNAGGWAKVFPKKVPDWLHKLRNYFNVEPKCLRLVDKNLTAHWMQEIRSHGQMDKFPITPGRIATRFSLSDDVYFDEEVEVWYQMSAGGSIYHWGDKPGIFGHLSGLDAVHTAVFRRQTGIPVFKLICPDGTGGSKETIITNPVLRVTRELGGQGVYDKKHRVSRIGSVNKVEIVIDRVVTNVEHQGSYNFAETSVKGLGKHETYDVEPHKDDDVYIDPPDRFAPLKNRIFNEFILHVAGAETKKKPATYADDVRENPLDLPVVRRK
jgi:hypothetical protein